MNFALRVKVISATAAAATIASILNGNARLIGVSCFSKIAATDACSFILWVTVAGIDYAIANGKSNAVTSAVHWWAGIDGRFKDAIVSEVVTNDQTNGFFPKGSPGQLSDFTGVSLPLKLSFTVAGAGRILVWYTEDTPSSNGEQL